MESMSRPLTDDEVDKIRLITGIQIKKDEYFMFMIVGANIQKNQKGETQDAL